MRGHLAHASRRHRLRTGRRPRRRVRRRRGGARRHRRRLRLRRVRHPRRTPRLWSRRPARLHAPPPARADGGAGAGRRSQCAHREARRPHARGRQPAVPGRGRQPGHARRLFPEPLQQHGGGTEAAPRRAPLRAGAVGAGRPALASRRGLLRAQALAAHLGRGRRGTTDQPGDPHPRPDAVAGRPRGVGGRARGAAGTAAPGRGRGHGDHAPRPGHARRRDRRAGSSSAPTPTTTTRRSWSRCGPSGPCCGWNPT